MNRTVEAPVEIPALYKYHADQQKFSGLLIANLMRDVLARGVPFRFQAGGSSMFPFIRDGDVISIGSIPAGGLVLGDTVAFLQPDGERLVIHRLVKKCKVGYYFKGDHYGSGEWDGPISKSNLLGIVSQVERKGRRNQLGLGPERVAIAIASRYGVLFPLVQIVANMVRPLKKLTFVTSFRMKKSR